MMTDQQLYLSIGAPVVFNGLLSTVLFLYVNARFDSVNNRFDSLNQRFDDMRDLWLAELRCVEEKLDARL